MAANKILVDTNILLYAYDQAEPEKQPQALAVLEDLVAEGLGVLSSQILGEFYVNATQKLAPPLTVKEAYERIQNYLLAWEVLDVTGPVVLEAVRGVREHKMAYWDAQIWASARLHQIPTIFSEDFNVGGVIEGVRFVNPLVKNFSTLRWLSE
ncbi:MAG: PIN domain-containing protein [Desulfobacterales bacterium]|nr:PIN domain-containing protein [Desulfobacterales bacterium]